jgi:hypothetical protein
MSAPTRKIGVLPAAGDVVLGPAILTATTDNGAITLRTRR